MTDAAGLLEAQLTALGRNERLLEDMIRATPAMAREAAVRGDFKRADELFTALEEAREALRDLQKRITAVEVRLYRLRRSRT